MFMAIGHMIKHGFQLGIYNLYQHIKLMGSAVLFKFVITSKNISRVWIMN